MICDKNEELQAQTRGNGMMRIPQSLYDTALISLALQGLLLRGRGFLLLAPGRSVDQNVFALTRR